MKIGMEKGFDLKTEKGFDMKPVSRNLIVSVLSLLAVCAFGEGSARADTIGIAVGSIGSNTQVGTSLLQPDGETIGFYIPLSPSGSATYGVAGGGLSSDTCTFPSCGGGMLTMYLRFAPVSTGPYVLTLAFNDLDIMGANDPANFLESVSIDDGVNPAVLVQGISDPQVVSYNPTTQRIALNVTAGSNPFYTTLRFGTSFTSGGGTWRNTLETVHASITPVPEPFTITLLGIGLIGVGIARRRFR